MEDNTVYGKPSQKIEYNYVNHPKHYNNYSMEVIDMFIKIYGIEATVKWCEMTALKYRMRVGLKPGNSVEQDLKKEEWYLNKSNDLRFIANDLKQLDNK